MPRDAQRNDVDPHDGLLDFGSEAPNSAVDTKEPDLVLNRNEPDAPLDRSEPVSAPPLHAPPVPPFVWYSSDPVVKSTRRNVGIALLMLGSVGVIAWSGPWLMEILRDAGTSGTQIQNASPPTPTVLPEAPTNVVPPPPDPQASASNVPAKTATPSEPTTAIATPPEAPAANAPAPRTERTERPAGQTEQQPVKGDPNAAGGLFAITRPVGAQVFLDNKLIGTTPLFMSQLMPGSHEVRLELPGFKTYSSSIQVDPNKRFRLAVQLDETR
jgi:hypothetical protein